MSNHTPIEWADSTVNPVMGCDGCELWMPEAKVPVKKCYAGQLHQVRAGRPGYADRFDEPKLFSGRMAAAARWSDLRGVHRADKPWFNAGPRVIFVSDMGDALSRGVPFSFLRDEIVYAVNSEKGRRHLWLWLTKQPHRMAEFALWLGSLGIEWPRNLWPGTSLTEPKYLPRVEHLRRVPAVLRFLSVEPLVADVGRLNLDGIGLVIVGGESGPGARPFDLTWARSIREQCAAAGVAVFVKQLGTHPVARDEYDMGLETFRAWDAEHAGEPFPSNGVRLALRDRKGGDPDEWPADLRVREWPEAA